MGNGHLVDVSGAIDLHFHPYPCLIPRLGDDVAYCRDAVAHGFRGMLLKCHHESTVSRAYLVRQLVPELEVFGGIVLNTYVGGINPAAVYAHLKLGAREVWMPTIDAWGHGLAYGRTGAYNVQAGGRDAGEGLKAVDGSGRLLPEVCEVLDLIAEHDAILGTCHLTLPEIDLLVREAFRRKVQKVLITHPEFRVPRMPLETLAEYTRLGAYAEFAYCSASPMWHEVSVEEIAAAIRRIGASRSVLISDTGQRHNPMPAEAVRIFAQCLFECGLPEADIRTMACANPAQLLGLPPLP